MNRFPSFTWSVLALTAGAILVPARDGQAAAPTEGAKRRRGRAPEIEIPEPIRRAEEVEYETPEPAPVAEAPKPETPGTLKRLLG